MKLFNIGNDIIVSTYWLIFLQLLMKFTESIPSRTTEINNKSSSQRLANIQRVTRIDKTLARENHQQKDNGTDFAMTTNESFMPTIDDFPELKNETFDTTDGSTGLPIIEEETSPFNLAAFNKVEQLTFPLDVDISSLPFSDSTGTPSFSDFFDESESKSDTEDSTHQIGDSLIDPKRIETEPFLTILVNSPPQVVTESSKPQSSSVSPSDSVNVPLSYFHVRVPIVPSVSAITIAPLSLLPLEPVSLISSSKVSPKNVEISSSVKAMNHSSLMSMSANVTAFPFIQPASVIIDLKPYSGQQVSTHNSGRQNFYKVLPTLFGIIYPVAPQTWIAPHSFSTQFQVEQSKFNFATSYGSPRAMHPLPLYGNKHQMFGTPPTPMALGFPPVSSTRDNLRHEVNWSRVGRFYRSKNVT
uniref:Uncharacterized protein n=1 Tax=Daphnia galeata TaxID=27404 RepID=A0A8J2WGS0_9CRUS|nr:unnamed protein product [Daphnia galeata]